MRAEKLRWSESRINFANRFLAFAMRIDSSRARQFRALHDDASACCILDVFPPEQRPSRCGSIPATTAAARRAGDAQMTSLKSKLERLDQWIEADDTKLLQRPTRW